MSEPVLTVPTAFPDIAQLSEGLADRVDEERIMLYGPDPVEDGVWVRFSVTLADQSVAIEGVGRAVASIDGGEERPDVARFDIVLDSLQLEGSSEVVYERILMVRSQAFGDQPATGEVSLDDVEEIEQQVSEVVEEPAHEVEEVGEAAYQEVAGEEHPPYHEAQATDAEALPDDYHADVVAEPDAGDPYAPAADVQWAEDGTDQVALSEDVESLPPSAPPPAPPTEPHGFVIPPVGQDGRVLLRPSREASWHPEAVPPPDAMASSGAFDYSGGLPIPAVPPRPPLDPSLRIEPAPRPQPGADAGVIHVEQPGEATDEAHLAATDPNVAMPEQELEPYEDAVPEPEDFSEDVQPLDNDRVEYD
jgi:hypothetical protein